LESYQTQSTGSRMRHSMQALAYIERQNKLPNF
jgi:hypothetical protein